jgi:hypothetical protein
MVLRRQNPPGASAFFGGVGTAMSKPPNVATKAVKEQHNRELARQLADAIAFVEAGNSSAYKATAPDSELSQRWPLVGRTVLEKGLQASAAAAIASTPFALHAPDSVMRAAVLAASSS